MSAQGGLVVPSPPPPVHFLIHPTHLCASFFLSPPIPVSVVRGHRTIQWHLVDSIDPCRKLVTSSTFLATKKHHSKSSAIICSIYQTRKTSDWTTHLLFQRLHQVQDLKSSPAWFPHKKNSIPTVFLRHLSSFLPISANRHLLAIPCFHLNIYGRRAFSVAGSMAWNSLKDFIWDTTSSTNCFRHLLKTYLFTRYCASRELGVLKDYELYKSTHSLSHCIPMHAINTDEPVACRGRPVGGGSSCMATTAERC